MKLQDIWPTDKVLVSGQLTSGLKKIQLMLINLNIWYIEMYSLGKGQNLACLCWEKSESIPSNIPSLGSLFQKIRYTEPTIGQLCLALGKAQTPWGAEIWNETFFLSVDLLQMLGQSKKNVFPNGGLTVSDLSWYKVIESQKKTNPSLCSKIQKKTSQEVAGWYRKISPKDKNPEMKRSVDYGISRSLRSWHLKKLSWGIQISSPLLPNLTFSLKRPKKERVPLPSAARSLASRQLSNLWLSDLPTESIRDFFLIPKPLKEVDFGRFYRFQIGTQRGSKSTL